jgi:hypothetical protein
MNQNDYSIAILASRPFALTADYLFFSIEVGRHLFGLKKPPNHF